uniref:tRNA (guanine(26)-N(2))-dimethyltransferase n=1 Tax=Geospiza parvula TaxID=87175 RepID=A0A8C3NN46_GEOPR
MGPQYIPTSFAVVPPRYIPAPFAPQDGGAHVRGMRGAARAAAALRTLCRAPPVPPAMDGASPNGVATPEGPGATPEGSAGPPRSERSPPGTGETLITEGSATIVFPGANEVFYNPVQGFNRDLTCAVLTEFARLWLRPKGIRVVLPGEEEEEPGGSPQSPPEAPRPARPGEPCEGGLRVLEALAASGLRSVRFAREVPGLGAVVASDRSARATELMARNVARNGVGALVTPRLADARMLMYQSKAEREPFDVIDLDPLREPRALPGRGRAGGQRGGPAVRDVHGHGGAGRQQRRDVLQQIRRRVAQGQLLPRDGAEDRAAQPGPARQLLPALRGAAAVGQRRLLRARLRQGLHGPGQGQGVFQQAGAGVPLRGLRLSYHLQRLGRAAGHGSSFKYSPATGPPVGPTCKFCQQRHQVGGPVWAEPLHDPSFVEGVLAALERSPGRFATEPRMRGMLSVIAEELSDVPLYYTLDGLSSTIRSNTPGLLQLRSALLHAGFRVSLSHACRNAVKTDAPPAVLWDIMRCWAKLHPVKLERLPESSPAARILSVEPTLQASFALHEDANPSSRRRGLKRFPENPEAFWGPKARAKPGGGIAPSLQEKRERLQNKRRQRPDGAALKRFPCKRFKEGACPHGEQCCYSHEPPPH